MALGPYSTMWVFVSFDLPTLTKQDRRYATRFRQDLLDLGFSMFQLSMYSYYVVSKDIAISISRKVMSLVPPNGHVTVFFITDKQFEMIQNYLGGKRTQIEEPEQGLLFD